MSPKHWIVAAACACFAMLASPVATAQSLNEGGLSARNKAKISRAEAEAKRQGINNDKRQLTNVGGCNQNLGVVNVQRNSKAQKVENVVSVKEAINVCR